jgi:hypothetical protein
MAKDTSMVRNNNFIQQSIQTHFITIILLKDAVIRSTALVQYYCDSAIQRQFPIQTGAELIQELAIADKLPSMVLSQSLAM